VKKKAPSPARDPLETALDLVRSETTLSLATTGKNGPWSAPVYYVLVDQQFFFFSSPQSRHIQQALDRGCAAASIYHAAGTWQEIRGLQMRGTVAGVRDPALAVRVLAAYLKRYPFTREFFPDGSPIDINAMVSRFKARLYAFSPTCVYYTDNRLGFGTRQRIAWEIEG
jgi:uncharacterized protein YhbP (UPF0306 family)